MTQILWHFQVLQPFRCDIPVERGVVALGGLTETRVKSLISEQRSRLSVSLLIPEPREISAYALVAIRVALPDGSILKLKDKMASVVKRLPEGPVAVQGKKRRVVTFHTRVSKRDSRVVASIAGMCRLYKVAMEERMILGDPLLIKNQVVKLGGIKYTVRGTKTDDAFRVSVSVSKADPMGTLATFGLVSRKGTLRPSQRGFDIRKDHYLMTLVYPIEGVRGSQLRIRGAKATLKRILAFEFKHVELP